MHLIRLSLLFSFNGCSLLLAVTILLLILTLILIFIDQYFQQVRQNLNAFLDFSFDEVEDAFCEVFVHGKSLRAEVVIGCAL